MADSNTISARKVVTLQYSLTNAAGIVIRAPEGKPIHYLQGSGGLFPKIEAALQGRRVGDVFSVRLLPDDAFGRRNPELLHEVAIDSLPPGERIEIGGRIVGTAEDGSEVVFTVKDVRDGLVTLDGNNPLAGQTLIFEIEIQGIRDATAEELRAGHALD